MFVVGKPPLSEAERCLLKGMPEPEKWRDFVSLFHQDIGLLVSDMDRFSVEIWDLISDPKDREIIGQQLAFLIRSDLTNGELK